MNTTPAPYSPQDDEVDLASILHELWGYKWLLVMTMTIGLFLGVFYAMRQPAQFQSNVLLQVDSSRANTKSTGFAEQLLLTGGSGDSAATQIALIQSRFILEPVVEKLGLNIQSVQQPTSLKERLFPWLKRANVEIKYFNIPQNLLNHVFSLQVDKAGEVALYDNNKRIVSGPTGVMLSGASGKIHLQVDAENDLPIGTRFSIVKRGENQMAKSLSSRLKVEEVGAKGMLGTGVLELSLKSTNKVELVRTLDAIAETARVNDAEKKSQEASQTLVFLERQLPIIKKLLEESEEALNAYRAQSGKIDIKIQTEFLLKQLADIENRLNMLQVEAIEMRQKFKKTHPAWIAHEMQIDALKVQRESLEKELKKLPASDQVAVNLMRDVEVKQSLYMLLLNKIQELQVVKAGMVSGVRILAHANMPNKPIPSKGRLIAAGGAMFGLILGMFFILGRKLLYSQVDDPHWSEKHLNLPNVAIVPFCAEQKQEGALISKNSLPLLAYSQPKNLAIEALRSLRTSLQVTLACADNNLISILGVAPGVGKSFVSSNLGYLLAAAGKRVLLIDSDLRKGTLHQYFGLNASPGLSDFLNGDLPLDDVLKPSIHDALTVIPRGHYPQAPSELLSSEKFKQLILNMPAKFDVVLFDTAPILLVTDAVLVGGLCATNFLVVGAGAHQPSDIELAVKRLKGANVPVSGTIFNSHKEQSRNYYGKYYAYYHDENGVEKV